MRRFVAFAILSISMPFSFHILIGIFVLFVRAPKRREFLAFTFAIYALTVILLCK